MIALLSALGLGALISTWVGWSKDRRAARGQVASALASVEQLRYAPNPSEYNEYKSHLQTFLQAQRSLEVAAMMAGLPRGVIETYIGYSAAGFRDSANSWTSGGFGRQVTLDPLDPKLAGNVDSDINGLIGDARELIIDLVWHPWRTRHGRRHLELLVRRNELVEVDPDSPLRYF